MRQYPIHVTWAQGKTPNTLEEVSKKNYDKQFITVTTHKNVQNYFNEKCAKYLMFHLEKYRGGIFRDNEEWCEIWRKTDLRFGKLHEEYGKFSPEQLEVSKWAYWWDPLIQSRKSVSLKSTEKLCVVKMKNDAKFEEELTCHFKTDMSNLMNFDPSTWKSQKFSF